MTLVAWILSCLLEGGMLVMVFYDSPRWGWAVLLHLASALAWGLSLRWPEPEPRAWIVAGLQACTVLLAPGFGCFLAIWMAWLYRRENLGNFSAAYREYTTYQASIAGRVETHSTIAMGIRYRMNIQSVTELLDEGDFLLKRKAIEHLAKRPTPHAVRLLRKALKDPHPDLQSYAAAALANIEGFINDEIRKAEDQAGRYPNSPSAKTYLGNKYFDYVYMGLLDPMTRQYYVARAAQAMTQSLALDPQQPDVLVRLGRIHLERQEWENALLQLNRALELEPQLGAALYWRAEAHYRLRQVAAAIQDVERAKEMGAVPNTMREAVEWLTTA